MPIHFRDNLYQGINAHLNSRLQQPRGGWLGFHNLHIVFICNALVPLLPSGYYANNEESLQVSIHIPDMPEPLTSRTYPDVAIYQQHDSYPQVSALTADAPTLTIPAVATIEEVPYWDSVVIYHQTAGDLKPVTRIELLSPANKPNGSNHAHYLANRTETLYTGISMVEIDYLHETPPLLSALPSYRDHHPDSYPYHIMVTDPRPTLPQGKTDIYSCGVNDPLPKIRIPLAGSDFVVMDMEAVYQETFAARPIYSAVWIDYGQPPIGMECYAPADQTKIQRVMAVAAQRIGG